VKCFGKRTSIFAEGHFRANIISALICVCLKFSGTIEEHKQISIENVFVKGILDDRVQAIEALSYVGVKVMDEDSRVGSEL
jgi:hypothetical protein